MRIVLASQSPRRRELLGWLGVEYEVIPSGYDESMVDCEDPEELVAELALQKALAVSHNETEGLVIGSDLVVFFEGKVIGKPKSREEAKKVLMSLSGNKHRILTGVAVVNVDTGDRLVEVAESEVEFKDLDEETVEKYLDADRWSDKAGGYAIQDPEFSFVAGVNGSFTNVVGLPLVVLVDMLERMGVSVDMDVRQVVMEKSGWKGEA